MHELLSDPSMVRLRPDIEWYLKLMNLIIHYELGNQNFLKYLLISTYRSLYGCGRLFKVEISLLNFIKKLARVDSPEKLKDSLLVLRNELYEIRNDKFEKKAFRYFNFIY